MECPECEGKGNHGHVTEWNEDAEWVSMGARRSASIPIKCETCDGCGEVADPVPTHYSCAFIIWPDGRRELRPICHVQGAQSVSDEIEDVDCLDCLRIAGERMKAQ